MTSAAPKKTFTVDHRLSVHCSLDKLFNNKQDADVMILTGSNEKPIYAHSLILRAQSEYFKTALSSAWTSSTTEIKKGGHDSNGSLGKIHTIRKPNIDYDVMLIIIQMLYTARCGIPEDLALPLVSASNELLLMDELAIPALDFIVTDLLQGRNAFKVFALACSVRSPTKVFRNQVASAIASEIDNALDFGAMDLAIYDAGQLKELLSSPILAHVMKWRIALHFTILKSGDDSVRNMYYIKKLLSQPDKNVEMMKQAAQTLEESFLPVISIFQIKVDDFEKYVMPAIDLLPLALLQQALQYRVSNKPVPDEELVSCQQLKSDLCDAATFRALQTFVNKTCKKRQRWDLVFSLSQTELSAAAVHSGDVLLFGRFNNRGVAGFCNDKCSATLFMFSPTTREQDFLPSNVYWSSKLIRATQVVNFDYFDDRKKYEIRIGNDLELGGLEGSKKVTVICHVGSSFNRPSTHSYAHSLVGSPEYETSKLEIYRLTEVTM
ncbi:hypothetical protein HDV05_001931 [Chytridiales sp. JEL 0842]|nr:hypothetical protein HDV05_001931 [Chytridiales sp. JEL 0842]